MSREAFEEWAKPRAYDLRRSGTDTGYVCDETRGAWETWQHQKKRIDELEEHIRKCECPPLDCSWAATFLGKTADEWERIDRLCGEQKFCIKALEKRISSWSAWWSFVKEELGIWPEKEVELSMEAKRRGAPYFEQTLQDQYNK